MLVLLAEILTDGVTFAFTVMFTVLEVAVSGDAQVAFEVNTQLTASLLTNDEVV
jgi:hypothetical protein